MEPFGEYDKFDVYVVTRRINAPVPEPEWIRMEGNLTEVLATLRQVRAAGGNGLVVPTRYRDWRVSRDQAQALALQAFRSIRESTSDIFSDLSEPEDEGACWIFSAENYTAQERGVIPGARSIRVDKLDGHIWSQSEAAAFLRLSAT